MIAMIFNDWNDGCWLFGIASGFEGLRDEGGWGSPSCPSSPACPAPFGRAPFATKGAGPVRDLRLSVAPFVLRTFPPWISYFLAGETRSPCPALGFRLSAE